MAFIYQVDYYFAHKASVSYRYKFVVDDSLTDEPIEVSDPVVWGTSPSNSISEQPQTNRSVQQPAVPPEEDTARNDAIAQHLGVMTIIERNLPSMEKDLASAKAAIQGRVPTRADESRIEQLAENIAVQKANLQSESDIIASIKSGTLVKTRTAWDDMEHKRFIGKIESEGQQLAMENRLAARLPVYANMVQGVEGVEAREWMQKSLSTALTAKDRLGQLKKIANVITLKIESQQLREQADAQEWEAQAQFGLTVSEYLKITADGAMLIGSLAFPPAGAVAMGYGIGVGMAEGGPSMAIENGVRAYSDKVDVIWAGYDGYYAKNEQGQPRGWSGAAENAATTFLMNKFMQKAGEKIQGLPAPKTGLEEGPTRKPSETKAEPVFDAYKDGNERLAGDRAELKKKYGDQDPSGNPEYARALEEVNKRNAIVTQRQALEQDIQAITAKHEEAIPREARNADGSVKVDHPDYLKNKAAWEREMKAAWDKHNTGYEARMKAHLGAVESAGLKFVETSSADPNWDIRMSGGTPKSIKSDIDMAARTMDSGRKFAGSMSDKGHHVLEYPDRWVITDTDTTLWKPSEAVSTFPIKIGSSEHEAQIALDAWRGSDKFPTEGGVQYTTGQGLYDPKGAVIANIKKASEAGISGQAREPDFHVIGKSVDKAAEIANKINAGDTIDEPEFMAKAQAVRQHQTPEQAGLVTFGNTREAKKREADAWLAKARAIIKRSYESGSKASRKVEQDYREELKAAVGANDKARQQQVREALVRIRVSNESALRTIGGHDPKLVKDLIQDDLLFDLQALSQIPPPPSEGAYGYGWLWSRIREDIHGAPPVPEPVLKGSTPELQALSARCTKSAKEIEVNIMPKLKKDSPEAAHMVTLKAILEQGRTDPIQAMRNARSVTGYELASVLKDFEPSLMAK